MNKGFIVLRVGHAGFEVKQFNELPPSRAARYRETARKYTLMQASRNSLIKTILEKRALWSGNKPLSKTTEA
jgi:hypothetical protein